MILFTVFVLILMIGTTTTLFSFWLLGYARHHPPTDWMVIHILGPVLRTISLIVTVSLIFPVLFEQASLLSLWRMLLQQEHFNSLLNILFFSSLLMSFLPFPAHPVASMPIQGCLAMAVVFDWLFVDPLAGTNWVPDWQTLLKLALVMMVVYYIGRKTALVISRKVDESFNLSGSLQLVADAIYLPLLLPVMMIYSTWLKQQLPANPVLLYN